MIKALGLSSLATFAFLASACAVEDSRYESGRFTEINVNGDTSEIDFESRPNNALVREGSIATNVSGYDIDGAAQTVGGYGDSANLYIDLSRRENDAAMALIDLTHLDHPAFNEVGRTTVFRNGEMIRSENADGDSGLEDAGYDPRLNLVACIGPEENQWEIDEPMEEVQVRVEESEEGETRVVLDSDKMEVELVFTAE